MQFRSISDPWSQSLPSQFDQTQLEPAGLFQPLFFSHNRQRPVVIDNACCFCSHGCDFEAVVRVMLRNHYSDKCRFVFQNNVGEIVYLASPTAATTASHSAICSR